MDNGDLEGAFRLLKRLFDELTLDEEFRCLAETLSRLMKEEERLYGAFNKEHARAFTFSPTQQRLLRAQRAAEGKQRSAAAVRNSLTVIALAPVLYLVFRYLFP